MLRRQLATPTVGNERVWRCTTGGTTGGSEPAWTLTKGSTTSDNGVVWTEVTGSSAHQNDNGVSNTWTAPHARVENMLSWMAAGDRGFVSSDHTQTKASSQNFTSPGITCQFFSVNRTTGNIPPTASDITNGAALTITGAGNSLAVNSGGFWQGFTLTAGSSTDTNESIGFSASSAKAYLKNCTLVLGGSGATGTMFLSSVQGGYLTLENPTFTFGNAGHVIEAQGGLTIIGGSISGGTIPTVLFGNTGSGNCVVADIRGLDASALTGGGSLISGSQPANPCLYTFADCKLSSAAGVVSSASRVAPDGMRVDLVNCDSGATGYRNERHRYQGDLTTETTITRTNGATDGVQKVSHKIVTTANAAINNPFECLPLLIWNAATGSSKTLTIEIISSGTLNNDDIWVEVDYLGSSSFPTASFVNNAIATRLTTHAAQTSSTAAWDSSPSTPVKQKLQVSFTPQLAGLVRAQVKVAAASTTVYIDPMITLA